MVKDALYKGEIAFDVSNPEHWKKIQSHLKEKRKKVTAAANVAVVKDNSDISSAEDNPHIARGYDFRYRPSHYRYD